MPLDKSCSKKSLQKNIDRLRHERGGAHNPPDKQSLAIAYSVLKKACGVKGKRKLTPSKIIQKSKGESMENKSVDQICEMLSAPIMVSMQGLGAQVACSPTASGENDVRTGVLMAIDDIDRQLNYYDTLANSLRNNGKDAEALEIKDMANNERKNKVRLRDILNVLSGND